MSPTAARRRAGTASYTASCDSVSPSVARRGPEGRGRVSCPVVDTSSITSAALVTSTACPLRIIRCGAVEARE
jgi:hypothetical protein